MISKLIILVFTGANVLKGACLTDADILAPFSPTAREKITEENIVLSEELNKNHSLPEKVKAYIMWPAQIKLVSPLLKLEEKEVIKCLGEFSKKKTISWEDAMKLYGKKDSKEKEFYYLKIQSIKTLSTICNSDAVDILASIAEDGQADLNERHIAMDSLIKSRVVEGNHKVDEMIGKILLRTYGKKSERNIVIDTMELLIQIGKKRHRELLKEFLDREGGNFQDRWTRDLALRADNAMSERD